MFCRITRRATLVAAALLIAGGCAAGSAPDASSTPADQDAGTGELHADELRQIEHPQATLTVPADWLEPETDPLRDIDADAITATHPDGSASISLARFATDVADAQAAVDDMVTAMEPAPGFALLHDEPIGVVGSNDAHSARIVLDSDANEGPLHITYVAAATASGDVLMLQMSGPRQLLSAQQTVQLLELWQLND